MRCKTGESSKVRQFWVQTKGKPTGVPAPPYHLPAHSSFPISGSPFFRAYQEAVGLFLVWHGLGKPLQPLRILKCCPLLRAMATRLTSPDSTRHPVSHPYVNSSMSPADGRQEAPFWAENGQNAWLSSHAPEVVPQRSLADPHRADVSGYHRVLSVLIPTKALHLPSKKRCGLAGLESLGGEDGTPHTDQPGTWQLGFPTDRALGMQALEEQSGGWREAGWRSL